MPLVSDWLIDVVVAEASVTVFHAPPLTCRWSLYDLMPSASQADHAIFTRPVELESVVFAVQRRLGAATVGALFVNGQGDGRGSRHPPRGRSP